MTAKEIIVAQHLGMRIRQFRELARYSQEDLAQAAGMHRTALVQVENGRQDLSTSQLRGLCLVLGVSADAILGIGGDEKLDRELAELTHLREELQVLAGRLARLARGER